MSPDRTLQLELLISEWSPTLWTHAPRVTDVATKRVLFDLWGTSWDARTAWVDGSGLRLDLRRYDLSGELTTLIDFSTASYRIVEAGGAARPLGDIRRGMDEAFEDAHRRYLESLTVSTPSPADTASPAEVGKCPDRARVFAALRRAVLIKRAASKSE